MGRARGRVVGGGKDPGQAGKSNEMGSTRTTLHTMHCGGGRPPSFLSRDGGSRKREPGNISPSEDAIPYLCRRRQLVKDVVVSLLLGLRRDPRLL